MAENNYAGNVFTMESYTNQTTDGSGQITVTLQSIPAADEAILVNLQGVAGAFAQFSSRSGKDVTFTVYQKYDKLSSVDNTLNNLPTSVTADSTSGGPTFTSGGNSSHVSNIGAIGGTWVASDGHTHSLQVNKISTHGHDVTQTATALSILASTGSITLVVAYAF